MLKGEGEDGQGGSSGASEDSSVGRRQRPSLFGWLGPDRLCRALHRTRGARSPVCLGGLSERGPRRLRVRFSVGRWFGFGDLGIPSHGSAVGRSAGGELTGVQGHPLVGPGSWETCAGATEHFFVAHSSQDGAHACVPARMRECKIPQKKWPCNLKSRGATGTGGCF